MFCNKAPPLDNWKRPPGRPHIMWLNTVQCELRAYNLTLSLLSAHLSVFALHKLSIASFFLE